jgi:hypothetical protein
MMRRAADQPLAGAPSCTLPASEVPMNFASVLLPLALTACGGDSSTGPDIAPPVLDSISPAHGTVGTLVRLNGSAAANDSVSD